MSATRPAGPTDAVDLVLATGNRGKRAEFAALLAPLRLRLASLEDFFPIQLPAEGDDYAANAAAKARAVALATGRPALADDSGIEVEVLGGRPGPRSARYGGPGLDDRGRCARLLQELGASRDPARRARFVCEAALARPDGSLECAFGESRGRILEAPRGAGGFGYDPIFEPEGHTVSMAELPETTKNRISHRGRALAALADALASLRPRA
jgi:XTP/dITP diphosphohydrolase